MKRSVLLLALFYCGITVSASTMGAQKSHVHGQLELQMVQEGKRLSMRLQSPLANIVGYEYQPVEAQDKWKLNQAINKLSALDWLVMKGQACTVEGVNVSYSWQRQGEYDAHTHHHSQGDNDHHHHHDEQGHDSGPASGSIDYELLCELDNLLPVAIELFGSFPAIESIEAQWISAEGQGAATLTSSQNLIRP